MTLLLFIDSPMWICYILLRFFIFSREDKTICSKSSLFGCNLDLPQKSRCVPTALKANTISAPRPSKLWKLAPDIKSPSAQSVRGAGFFFCLMPHDISYIFYLIHRSMDHYGQS